MKEIQLTKGFVTKVDDSDYEALVKYKWYASKHCNMWYAKMRIGVSGKNCSLYMHRVLLGLYESNVLADHKDRDGLNNQRSNLRSCTKAENQRNRTKRKNTYSQYKGVTKAKGLWAAHTTFQKKHIDLGRYKTEEEAALVYDEWAIKHHGEFANINFAR